MTRRSPSPEGVGDLLKQDSFGEFDDDDNLDVNMLGDGAVNEIDDDFNVTLDEQEMGDVMKDSEPLGMSNSGADLKQRMGRQPIPHFPTASIKGSDPPANARYYIIKSNNHSNIEQSLKYGIWATQKHNEDKFAEVYKSGAPVYLIFSVNMSGHFQGYAKMCGMPFKHKQGLWGGGAAVSNSFDIEWIRRYDLAFRDLEHIRNPLNEDKPIKISRDGQELPSNLGRQVLQLFDQGATIKQTPNPPPADRNHDFNIGPAVGGYTSFRGPNQGMGMGRGGIKGPQPPKGPPPNVHQDKQNGGLPMGMVMTPMGPMPAQMAMQMGAGMMGPGMEFNPAMMNMGHPMMGMGVPGMDQMAAMQAMMGNRVPGMMGMGPPPSGPRGPVPPPKPPPPKSPPQEADFMSKVMESALLRNARSGVREERGRSREEDILLKAMELSRRGGSPRDRYRYRSRSRSPSPRRYRSHRRSRSRSRSRSPGRHGHKATDLSYEDYLQAYNALKKSRKEKETGLDFGGGMSSSANPLMAQMMANSNPKPQISAVPNSATTAMNKQSTAGGVGNMSEADYVQLWQNYSRQTGNVFNESQVRSWYRHHKMTSMKK